MKSRLQTISNPYLLFILILLSNFNIKAIQSAAFFEPQGGMLGNSLLAYAHAKWFAYKYNLELLYPSFPYSDQLRLHENEKIYTQETLTSYKNIINLQRGKLFNPNSIKNTDTAYQIPWFVPFKYEGGWAQAPFQVDWNDQQFLEILKQNIAPRDPTILNAVPIQKNKISVAVHLRKEALGLPLLTRNGDEECVYKILTADQMWPQKFPPHSYYIQYIKEISKMFNHAPLYVHIFTDDPHPEVIVQKYLSTIRLPNIEYGYRKIGNGFNKNVLEDLFAIAQCDCLIMPASAYSYVAAKIGNHKIVIMPTHHRWRNGQLIIDGVEIVKRS